MAPFPSLGELTLSEEVSPAAWVLARVRNFDGTVGSLLPSGFDGYARLFHPAYRNTATAQDEEVTWRAVAQANGRTAHPGMEWVAITGSWRYVQREVQPGLWDHPPNTGSLPSRQTAQLAELLAAHTSTPAACWFAVWEGFGYLLPALDWAPRVAMPQRPMVLLSGPLHAATTSLARPPWDQRASLWWPDDRAWCVATDVDSMSTYVVGSRQCIAALLDDDELEVLPVSAEQTVTWDGDRVNPTPPRQA